MRFHPFPHGNARRLYHGEQNATVRGVGTGGTSVGVLNEQGRWPCKRRAAECVVRSERQRDVRRKRGRGLGGLALLAWKRGRLIPLIGFLTPVQTRFVYRWGTQRWWLMMRNQQQVLWFCELLGEQYVLSDIGYGRLLVSSSGWRSLGRVLGSFPCFWLGRRALCCGVGGICELRIVGNGLWSPPLVGLVEFSRPTALVGSRGTVQESGRYPVA